MRPLMYKPDTQCVCLDNLKIEQTIRQRQKDRQVVSVVCQKGGATIMVGGEAEDEAREPLLLEVGRGRGRAPPVTRPTWKGTDNSASLNCTEGNTKSVMASKQDEGKDSEAEGEEEEEEEQGTNKDNTNESFVWKRVRV